MTGGADEGVAGGAVPGDVPRLLPDHILRRQEHDNVPDAKIT